MSPDGPTHHPELRSIGWAVDNRGLEDWPAFASVTGWCAGVPVEVLIGKAHAKLACDASARVIGQQEVDRGTQWVLRGRRAACVTGSLVRVENPAEPVPQFHLAMRS